MRLTKQSFIIEAILEAFDKNIFGVGMKMKCNINYQLDGENSFIDITVKEGYEVTEKDWFWFGFYIREHVVFE